MTLSRIFGYLFLISVLFGQCLNAQQTNEILWVEKFDKVKKHSIPNKTWYQDGPGTKLECVRNSERKSNVARFFYSFQNEKSEAIFAAMIRKVSLQSIYGENIEGIAYEFKGSQHSLACRTSSALDYGFFQKKIPKSKDWTTVIIPFSELSQPLWANKVQFNYHHIQALSWQIWGSPNDTGSILIDNIRFILSTNSTKENSVSYYFEPKEISGKIFNIVHDSLMREVKEYKLKSGQYYQSINCLRECERKLDSIHVLLKASSMSDFQKDEVSKLFFLVLNEITGDVTIELNKIDKKTISKYNRILPVSFIVELDEMYSKNLIQAAFLEAWAMDIWDYATSNKIRYVSKSIPDSLFRNELLLYKFRNNDTIAELGAGDGYFEQAISKYCDNLVCYVTEIDSASVNKLEVKLKFLDLFDNKNIRYITVLGDSKATNLPIQKFDVLIIKNSFHHFTYPDEMLQTCKKNLKANGKLVMAEIMMDEVENPECKLFFPREVFMDYLTKNGFKLVNEVALGYHKFRNFEFVIIE